MGSVQLDGGRRVHYDEMGTGSPLLLIPGLGAARSFWSETVDVLSPHFRVIALDNRDAGASAPETNLYSIDDMANDTAGLLRALSIQRTHIMGISMGGFIAQHLALNHPELVERLVLVATSPAAGIAIGWALEPPDPATWVADPVERTRQSLPLRVAPSFSEEQPGRLEELAQQARGNQVTVEGYTRQLAAISDTHDVRVRLPEITAPTLVIHGDQDPLIPLVGGRVLATGIRNARLMIFTGVGHLPPLEVPEEFQKAVLAFLTEG